MPQWLYRSVVQGIMLEVKFIKNLRDDESKKILKEEATWYFLALAGLLILLYMGANVIIDTYFYMISLNILIFLFSYITSIPLHYSLRSTFIY